MMSEISTTFDAVADEYDEEFTNTTLGGMLRGRVWSLLGRHFPAGDLVLRVAGPSNGVATIGVGARAMVDGEYRGDRSCRFLHRR